MAQALCYSGVPEEQAFVVAKNAFPFMTLRETHKGVLSKLFHGKFASEKMSKACMEEIRKVAGEPLLPEGFAEILTKAEAFVGFSQERYGISEMHAIGELLSAWYWAMGPEKWESLYIQEPTWSIEEYESANA
jgi:hypothetical protein